MSRALLDADGLDGCLWEPLQVAAAPPPLPRGSALDEEAEGAAPVAEKAPRALAPPLPPPPAPVVAPARGVTPPIATVAVLLLGVAAVILFGQEEPPAAPLPAEPAALQALAPAASEAPRAEEAPAAPNGAEWTLHYARAATAPPDWLPRCPRLVIEGHTCDLGPEPLNVELAARRAEGVRARLLALGLPKNRLTTRAAGSSAPVAPNTPEGRRMNRRVTVTCQP
jgi:hypothetical protein